MTKYTLTESDILYLTFYLKDKDGITGSITPHDLSNAQTINFYMRKQGASTNTISNTCEIVTDSLGICRVKVTVPVNGDYVGEVEIIEAGQRITFGPVYFVVREELG